MRRAAGARALVVCSALSILAACGGRVPLPTGATGTTHGVSGTEHAGSGGTTSTSTGSAQGSTLPTLPPGPTPPSTTTSSVAIPGGTTPTDPTKQAVLTAYETYLVDLSGLDDTLSQGYIAPLAAVTTNRLAQASVRQAAALLAAHEHGVGTLRDDKVTVVLRGSDAADITDCQDEFDFYLVADSTGTADPFVQRGDFAGAAQLVVPRRPLAR